MSDLCANGALRTVCPITSFRPILPERAGRGVLTQPLCYEGVDNPPVC
jgi:hypothetical protein